jgi:hypothetical protein
MQTTTKLQLFKCVYRIEGQNQDWTAHIVSHSPEAIRSLLTARYGDIPRFAIENRTNIDLIHPSIIKEHHVQIENQNKKQSEQGEG